MNWANQKLSEVIVTDFDGAWGDLYSGSEAVTVLRSTDMRSDKLVFSNAARCKIAQKTIEKKKLQSGDLLVNKSSGSSHLVGKCVLFTPPDKKVYLCSNFIRCLRPDRKIINPELLFYILQSPDFKSQAISAQRTTSGLRNVKISEYIDCIIKYPSGLNEQDLILSRIKECMERVEEIERLRTETKTDIKSAMRSFYAEIYQKLLKSCPTRPFKDCGKISGGGTPSKQNQEFWTGPIPWVSPKEMKIRELFTTSLTISESAVSGSSVKLIEKPSVLFVVRGMILAHTLPVAVNRVPVTLNQDMKAVTPAAEVDVDFLAAMLRGAERCLLQKIEIAGHGTCRLKTEDWSDLPIPVLSPLEQETVVEKVKEMEQIFDSMHQDFATDEISLIRDAILRKAFAGEL